MKIRILGGGFYGCHLAMGLIADGHDVVIHEIKDRIFGGASGAIPARIHQGFHYPRSKRTRDACQEHIPAFMDVYGMFTRSVPLNIYAIASELSMVDYDQYVQTLTADGVWFEEVDPALYGLHNVEGAVQTAEQHIIVNDVREHFETELDGHIIYAKAAGQVDSKFYDLTIDATFCANESAGIDRYEPCVVGLLSGPTDTAVTIMDGPFASLYPWDERRGLNSLSSAKWTPFSKTCKSWVEAQAVLNRLDKRDIYNQLKGMFDSLEHYYPLLKKYSVTDFKTSVRAMPLSGADSRLVDVVQVGERALRVRAGKIDAVIHAEALVKKHIEDMS